MLAERTLRILLLAVSISSTCGADITVDVRHVTQDAQGNYKHYGCDTCTPDFGPLPPNSAYGGLSIPSEGIINYSPTGVTNATPFRLMARAGAMVTIDQSNVPPGTDSWSRAQMHVVASESFVDVALVEGVPGGQTGIISFAWVLTGQHELNINTENNLGTNTVVVEQLSTTAVLTADTLSLGGFPSTPLDSTNSYPGTGGLQLVQSQNENYSQDLPAVSEVLMAFVPFTQGTALPVNFDLSVYADLEIGNLDAAKVSATLDADFSNTGTIKVMSITDTDGNPLSGAYLESTTLGIYPTAVPEPSAFVLVGLIALLAIGQSRFRH